LSETTGIVFDVSRFALHDGPGIRTTVFFKGCPLRCQWCQNPESQAGPVELFYVAERCAHCLQCVDICPEKAVSFTAAGVRTVNERCTLCGECARVCAAGATLLAGKRRSVGELVERVLRDRPFFRKSGGGVTLSGGEALAQAPFAAELLAACHAEGIHTALDTTGYAAWEKLEALLPHVDLVLLDLKVMDAAQHRRLTGVDNAVILENARRLAETGVALTIRIPVIPGLNDDEENLAATAAFLKGLPSRGTVELLPYNRLAESKYQRFGRQYSLAGLATPGPDEMDWAAAVIGKSGWRVRVIWGLGVPNGQSDAGTDLAG
jgi:pyruvate formate lyase activating enzyme